jgi:predicted DNA-binding transcriptional regulator
MVIDCRINLKVNYDLLSFLKDIGCGGMQFKLLCFWGRHPKAKLSLYTIARALDTARIDLRDAITALLRKGVLIAEHNSDGLTTYALSDDKRTQEYIDELAKLDWSETKNLGKQLKEEVVLPTNKRE